MKTRIKKEIKTWQYVVFFSAAILMLIISFWWREILSQLCLLWIICAIVVFTDYFIVDKTYLKRRFAKIDIRQIQEIIQQTDGMDICYLNTKNKREGVLHFRPQDRADLIAQLLEINPNIKIK